jgi:hypothetical protein
MVKHDANLETTALWWFELIATGLCVAEGMLLNYSLTEDSYMLNTMKTFT